jgi:nitric oxide reductase subunit C
MKRSVILTLAAVLVLSLLLAACGGGGGASGGAGDATRGKALYEQTVIGPNAAPGCITCHSLDAGTVLVGPSHAGLASKASTAVSGKSAEEYLKESIMTPDAHVTEGFQAGVMYQNYAKDLSELEINDLVAFMLTLK